MGRLFPCKMAAYPVSFYRPLWQNRPNFPQLYGGFAKQYREDV